MGGHPRTILLEPVDRKQRSNTETPPHAFSQAWLREKRPERVPVVLLVT